MQFVSPFEVPLPIDEAWTLLGDIPKIAPCLPGATVKPLEDDKYEGEVSVKVGPIRAGYSGLATVTRRDEKNHVMVLEGAGSESGGKGTASATISLALSEIGPSRTGVEVTTDLTITGRLAQFGRSAMADVSQRLVAQFATNLATLAGGDSGAAHLATASGQPTPPSQQPTTSTSSTVTPASTPAQESSSLDLTTLAVPALKRVLPVVGGAAGLILLGALIGRRRGLASSPSLTSLPTSGHAFRVLIPVELVTTSSIVPAGRQ